MAGFLSIRLRPKELEERFRLETLARDKIQMTVIIAVTSFLIAGFVALDLYFLPSGLSLYVSIAARCAATVMSLLAIWMVRRQSQPRSFDRIVFVWALIDIAHLLVVNALRPADYVGVVVWDLVSIFTLFLLVPIPLRLQVLLTLLLSCGSRVLWLVFRLPVSNGLETWAILSAYITVNGYGVFASARLGRLHRQQFTLYEQEQRAKKELEAALAEVKVLRGIIPICANCKRIRNDTGYYEAVEAYVSRYSEAHFSHTICPECFAVLYPEIYEEKLRERGQQDTATDDSSLQ